LNAILGLTNLDGAPAAEPLQAMQEALAFWARDGAGMWSAGQTGLGCLQLASTPEALGEHLPKYDAASGLALTAGARLDNRSELLHHLNLEAGRAQAAITDSEIILHAYQRWGEDCVLHLDGDWHFAVWDERAHRLFLARDHHGNTGLYYYHGPRCFAFASSKKALLALESVPKQPNLLRLAQVLAAWPGDGTQTGYEKILRLPPAHRMVVTPDGASFERYWFPEHITELHLKSDDEYVAAFLEAFTRAVSARLRSQHPVGVALSSGLDSGAVAAVAAGLLRERGDQLVAYTAVPLSDPSPYTGPRRYGDEARLAQETAHRAGISEHHLLRTEAVTPMAGIERMLWVHDEAGHAAGNQFWIADMLEAARQRQLGVLLTGQLGNAVISWGGGGENLLPLLLRAPLPRHDPDEAHFWQTFETARAHAGLGRWRAARRFLLKPLLLPFWIQIQRRWRLGSEAWQAYSALRPDFARTISLSRKMAEAGYLPGLASADPLQQRLSVIQPGQSILGASWLEKGGAYGLEVRDPTQDRRLIELCLAIPEAQFQRNGVNRWLIRRAMEGHLPEAVRLNTRRGLQAADIGLRVLANRDEIEADLARLAGHNLARQVLDLPRLAAVLASLENGVTPQNSADCNTILLRGLMVGLFLLRFSDT
jgi:asparagine synthase (glutamine-hydrolysing)